MDMNNLNAVVTKQIQPHIADQALKGDPFVAVMLLSERVRHVNNFTDIREPLFYADLDGGFYTPGDAETVNTEASIFKYADYGVRYCRSKLLIPQPTVEGWKDADDVANDLTDISQDTTNDLKRKISSSVYTIVSQGFTPITSLVDDTTIVGGVDPATNSWWKSVVENNSGAGWTDEVLMAKVAYGASSTNMFKIEQLIDDAILDADSGIKYMVAGSRMYKLLRGAIASKETVPRNDLVGKLGFKNFEFAGIPVLHCGNAAMNNLIIGVDTDHLKFKIVKSRNFKVGEFKDTENNIDSFVAKVKFAGAITMNKRKCHFKIDATTA